MLRFHGGDGTVVLRVYGGDRGAQGLWWGYQCSGSMVGIGVLRSMVGIIVLIMFHVGDGTVVLRFYGGDRSAQGLWWG